MLDQSVNFVERYQKSGPISTNPTRESIQQFTYRYAREWNFNSNSSTNLSQYSIISSSYPTIYVGYLHRRTNLLGFLLKFIKNKLGDNRFTRASFSVYEHIRNLRLMKSRSKYSGKTLNVFIPVGQMARDVIVS